MTGKISATAEILLRLVKYLLNTRPTLFERSAVTGDQLIKTGEGFCCLKPSMLAAGVNNV